MTDYIVFCPGSCEGMTYGLEMVRVRAATEADAIRSACEQWYGTGAREGTYLVVEAAAVAAFEVEEARIPSIKARVSLPGVGSGD